MENALNDNTPATSEKACVNCSSAGGFNYCLFSKTLVALPALSVVAYVPTTFFASPLMQITASVVSVVGAVYFTIWLDRLPGLRNKIKPLIFSTRQG